MAHTLQERYAALVDMRLRAALVTTDAGSTPVFNTRYEGSPKAGAVKIPVRDAETSVSDYDKVTGASLSTGTTTYLTVTDFNDKVVNELIDGFDAQAVPDNIVADRLDSAGYTGSQILDTDALKTLAAQGTMEADHTDTTSSNVYSRIVDARQALSEANVPPQGRYLIVSPSIYSALLKDTTNFIRQGDMSQTLVNQGYTGMIAGFAVKESNNMPGSVEFIAGHSDWCHRVREWIVLPHVQDLNGDGAHIGASAVQGRWIYKHKVSKAAAVYVKFLNDLTVTSEAGTASGDTKITVTPALVSGHTYAYKTAASVAIPQYGIAPTGFTAWNGTADITATTGNDIVIAELDAGGLTVKTGTVEVVSKA